MSFNLPIITTIHEGNEEWIKKFAVTIFKSESTENLEDKMRLFYKLKPKKRKYNLKKFDYHSICKNILKIYDQI